MKHLTRNVRIGSVLLAAVGVLLWQFSLLSAIMAVASLSDPAKLAILGERGANSRLNKIVYWLHAAQGACLSPGATINLAQTINWTREPRAGLVRESLLRNMKKAEELGLFTSENLVRLRRGHAGIVTQGPYTRSLVEIDHIVPYSLAKEVGNELANLEMLPELLNRRKSNHVGERQLSHAQRLYEAGLLTAESLARVQAHARK